MASRFFGARYCAAVQSRRAFLVHVPVAQRRIAEIERAEMSNCSECEEEEGVHRRGCMKNWSQRGRRGRVP